MTKITLCVLLLAISSYALANQEEPIRVQPYPCVEYVQTNGRLVCVKWQQPEERYREWHRTDPILPGIYPNNLGGGDRVIIIGR